MKRTLLTMALGVALTSQAQTVIYTENFDGFTADDYLGTQSSDWTTWSNAPGGQEDAMISTDQAASGANSVKVESATGQGPTDLLLPFNDYTTGIYALNFNMYVASGNGGYFNVQKTSTAGQEWSMEVFFDASSGGGTVNAGGADAAMFQYTQDTWTEIEVYMNLDADSASLTIGGTLVHSWQYSLSATGDPGMTQLGGVNIFGAAPTGQSALFYFDDVTLTQLPAVGINEATLMASTYPNPSEGNITVALPESTSSVDYVLYDMIGNKVAEGSQAVLTNQFRLNLNDFQQGLYILETRFNNKKTVNKISLK